MLYHVITNSGMRSRVWIDHESQSDHSSIGTVKFSVQGQNASISIHREVCVELYLPQNVSNYALLGASYTSTETNTLNVIINVTAEDGPIVEDHIAFRNDVVRSGIPEFYAKKIKEFFLEKSEENRIMSGELYINSGAHAEIGSSAVIFKMICQILIELCESTELSESDIVSIFQNNLKTKSSIIVKADV